METTQRQKYEILQEEIQNGVGLNQIIKMGLEILMKSECKVLKTPVPS